MDSGNCRERKGRFFDFALSSYPNYAKRQKMGTHMAEPPTNPL